MKKILIILFFFQLIITCDSLPGTNQPEPQKEKSFVYINQNGDNFSLYVNNESFYIKGVAGTSRIKKAAAIGANSFRTWSSDSAGVNLETAYNNNMMLLLGIWLSHDIDDYFNSQYLKEKRDEVQNLLDLYKDHPALLIWALGNENYMATGKNSKSLEFINELAEMIHEQDPNHPVTTVQVGTDNIDINAIVDYAPAIDIISINIYGGLSNTHEWIENSRFNGPYMITEWGVNGYWEVNNTSWEWPIESASDAKAEDYLDRYTYIYSKKNRCLGSYVFSWDQKQECTPTWFSLFIEDNVEGIDLNGESSPVVDVMKYCWTGSYPDNRAPAVTKILINGKEASQNITLSPNFGFSAFVFVSDPDGDNLKFIWEILEQPTDHGAFGSNENRPARIGTPFITSVGVKDFPNMQIGHYILFVYVFDNNDHVGTANIPFIVE